MSKPFMAHWAMILFTGPACKTCNCISEWKCCSMTCCTLMVQDAAPQQALALAPHHIAGPEDTGNFEQVMLAFGAQLALYALLS